MYTLSNHTDIEGGLEGVKSKEKWPDTGLWIYFQQEVGNGLDLGVTTEVERNRCILRILNVELLGLVIAWFWSIREREDPEFFI